MSKKIVLLCCQGMSTSMLVSKMQKAAEKQGLDYNIAAHPIASAASVAADADLILLGPQVRFQQSKVQKELPDKKVEVIDMRSYGMMDGEGVVGQCKKLIGE